MNSGQESSPGNLFTYQDGQQGVEGQRSGDQENVGFFFFSHWKSKSKEHVALQDRKITEQRFARECRLHSRAHSASIGKISNKCSTQSQND